MKATVNLDRAKAIHSSKIDQTLYFLHPEDAPKTLKGLGGNITSGDWYWQSTTGTDWFWEMRSTSENRGFDLSVFDKKKSNPYYGDPPYTLEELRFRVMKYCLLPERSDGLGAIRNLFDRGFFTDSLTSLTRGKTILDQYLDTQCKDGKNRALKYLGYKKDTEWKSRQVSFFELFNLIEDHKADGIFFEKDGKGSVAKYINQVGAFYGPAKITIWEEVKV